jgi:hypothetical protein
MPEFPTAHEVAVAIVAASRETGACPLRVASGQRDAMIEPMAYETSRARAYAAMALKALTTAGPTAIGRMVGTLQPDVYLSGLAKRIATKKHAWWSEVALARVCAAVEGCSPTPEPHREPAGGHAPPPTPKAAAPAARPPRPAATPGKRKLEDMLREAVQNTQAMTPREGA